MSRRVKILKMWIISPNLPQERRAARQVVSQVNQRLLEGGIPGMIIAVGWEDLPPILGEDPQAQIDAAFADWDIVLGFMADEFGGRAGGKRSGTKHELREALRVAAASGTQRRILFYFGGPNTKSRSPEAANQWALVTKFRKSLMDRRIGLIGDYRGLSDFRQKLEKNLFATAVKMVASGVSDQATAHFWKRRLDISAEEWLKIFSSATKRIWLLGHTMHPAVDPQVSGGVIAGRLAEGVDVRLLVPDPYGGRNDQIREFAEVLEVPSLRRKVLDTLEFAARDERDARTICALHEPNAPPPILSIGLMQDTVNNSVVIVDDRMLVTLYSHIKDFGSKGITLDLSNANDRHNSPLKNA